MIQKLADDFSEDEYKLDVTKFHTYAANWSKDSIVFLIDNKIVKVINHQIMRCSLCWAFMKF